MNPATFVEARKLFEATKKAADTAPQISIVVASSTLYLRELAGAYRGKKLSFAVQHAHAEATGSYTGEVSLLQAKNAGASYAIVGHAERRAMGETNDDTRTQVAAALALSMTPILCVGEKERTPASVYFDFIKEQIKVGLSEVKAPKLSRIVIAYEPVWAIGATKPMSSRDMHEMAIFIRKTVVGLFGEKGMLVKILYGGSIDALSAPDMLLHGDIAGLLVGRASTTPQAMTELIRSIKSI